MTEFQLSIQGFNGKAQINQKGTWKFKIEDDQGISHGILVRITLYASQTPYHSITTTLESTKQGSRRDFFLTKHDKMIL